MSPAQQSNEAAGPSGTTAPSFPCPPGYAWDGKRFYKLPPHLAKVTPSREDARIERERVHRDRCVNGEDHPSSAGKGKPGRVAQRGGGGRGRGAAYAPLDAGTRGTCKRGQAPPSLKGKERADTQMHPLPDDPPAVASSAFASTPAHPPACFGGAFATGANVESPLSSHLPATSGSTKRWKRMQIQRHVRSFEFYSRDTIDLYRDGYSAGSSRPDEGPVTVKRMATHEETGSTVWLAFDYTQREDAMVNPSLRLDSGHRPLKRARRIDHSVVASEPTDAANVWVHRDSRNYQDLHHRRDTDSSDRSIYPVAFLESDERRVPDRLHTMYTFDVQSNSLRGIRPHSTAAIASDPGWAAYPHRIANESPSDYMAAMVAPSLHPGKIDKDITASVPSQREAPARVRLVVTYDGVSGPDNILLTAAVQPSSLPGYTLPPGKHFCASTISELTGYCWVGRRDGSIQVLDTLAWLSRRRKQHRKATRRGIVSPSKDPSAARSWQDEWRDVDLGASKRGAVSNLLAVGSKEVIAAFTDGSVVLLSMADDLNRVHVLRELHGHVNLGTTDTLACVHSPSRLLALRGTDDRIRIWHLDEPYPLTSAWHDSRVCNRGKDLLPAEPLTQMQSHLQRQKASSSASPAHDPRDTYGQLAHGDLRTRQLQTVMRTPLSDLHTSRPHQMCFAPTAWTANRDVQWELTRGFDSAGQAQLIGAGLLPSLVTAHGGYGGETATLLYFEHQRHPET